MIDSRSQGGIAAADILNSDDSLQCVRVVCDEEV